MEARQDEPRALIVQEGNVVTITQGGKTSSYRIQPDGAKTLMLPPEPPPPPPVAPEGVL